MLDGHGKFGKPWMRVMFGKPWMHVMFRNLLRVLILYSLVVLVLAVAAFADDRSPSQAIQEEVWAIPVTLPTIAYVVRPVGDGPFPLVVMNHGVSLNQRERGFFPLVEFRDAAMWFARRGYMVVAPSGSGYGAAALDDPERGLYSVFYSKIGGCDNLNFRRCTGTLPVALVDKWIIDYMTEQKLQSCRTKPPLWSANLRAAGRRLRCRARICRRYGQSLRLRQAAAGASAAKPKQQLRTRPAGRGYRRIRPHRSHPDAVDLCRERHVLWPIRYQANA